MRIQVENIHSRKPRRRKKAKFGISINEQGRATKQIRQLKQLLKEKYPFLMEEKALYREKSLKAAKPGDYIVFGIGKGFDYTVLTSDSFMEDERISDKIDLFDLQEGFKLVKKALKRYVQKNYPWKAPIRRRKKYYCEPRNAVLLGTRPVVAAPRVVAATQCQPVRVVRTPRPKTNWDIEVNNTYVLLTDGTRYVTRPITRCGSRETVVLDGTRYTIRRDSYGKGIVL